MNAPMNSAMLEALRLTRAGHLFESTALLQRALHGEHATRSTSTATDSERDVVLMDGTPTARLTPHADEPPVDAEFVIVGETERATGSQRGSQRRASAEATSGMHARPVWPRVDGAARRGNWKPLHGPLGSPLAKGAPPPLPEGAQFLTESFANRAGTRGYKLYVPSSYRGQALPLVVMLHGCTQDPDDFAAGTKMNELAEKQPCLVLYPAQTGTANGSKCWNWFKATDQQRDHGEPSIIAGMTREVCNAYAIDTRRVYIAGLSAGGAMAVTLAVSYPELYAAVGIHSGLPHAVARDLPSALAAMQQGRASPLGGADQAKSSQQAIAAIVFHGDRDTTVHPGNGDRVLAQCMPPAGPQALPDSGVMSEYGQVSQGHAYTRTLYNRLDGHPLAEHWLIHGAGHAWSGGSTCGSYTDPKGPDASAHMLRFFLAHPRSEAVG